MILYFDSFQRSEQITTKMPETEKKDKTADYPVGPDGKKLKPCCVCPETKVQVYCRISM